MADKWMPQPGEIVDGRYRLDGLLGRGGMGVIAKATDLRVERTVALKFLHPRHADEQGYVKRFQREVKLSIALQHPHVVATYDHGETAEGGLYLVLELIEGRTLHDEMLAGSAFSTGRTLDIGLQLLDGLSAAHALEIVHRDLKPANVMLTENHRGEDRVKLLDFGLARALNVEQTKVTKTGAVVGTASYMAPEAIVTRDPGKPGDVYALAIIMLEMLFGRKLFEGEGTPQNFIQHLVCPMRIPVRLWDTGFGQVLAKATEKYPPRRYADAEQMYQALRGAVSETPDFTLFPDELPPRVFETFAEGVLHDIAGDRDAEKLRSLPVPEPYFGEQTIEQSGLHLDVEALRPEPGNDKTARMSAIDSKELLTRATPETGSDTVRMQSVDATVRSLAVSDTSPTPAVKPITKKMFAVGATPPDSDAPTRERPSPKRTDVFDSDELMATVEDPIRSLAEGGSPSTGPYSAPRDSQQVRAVASPQSKRLTYAIGALVLLILALAAAIVGLLVAMKG